MYFYSKLMMNILLCPDSFKGSMTSKEFCLWAQTFLKDRFPQHHINYSVMADGGEGSLEALINVMPDATIHPCEVVDAIHRPLTAHYLTIDDTAYVELAIASGLSTIEPEHRSLTYSNTFGTGMVIRKAYEAGFRKFVLFCGGSATIDGGTGILQALGFNLLDAKGNLISDRKNGLLEVVKIEDTGYFRPESFTLVLDVQNPLCGEKGAAKVYGPQKAGLNDDLNLLDRALIDLFKMINQSSSSHHTMDAEGLGAAGGMALGLSYFTTKWQFGKDYFMKLTGLPEKIKAVDWVITGEGKFDVQSFMGKLTGSVINLCSELNKKCFVICGKNEFPVVPGNVSVVELSSGDFSENSMLNPRPSLENALLTVFAHNME